MAENAKNEKKDRQPRRLVIALPEEKANLLRRVAEMTGIPQTELLDAIEGHELFASACAVALKERFEAWRQGLGDPFMAPKPVERSTP